MFRRDARPVIFDAEQRSVRRALPAYGNVRARRRMVDRVIDQVGNGAAQLFFITQYFQRFIDRKMQHLPLLA